MVDLSKLTVLKQTLDDYRPLSAEIMELMDEKFKMATNTIR
ncbi:hypothetical protein [Lentibacillus sp. CBA3610]|nr:hypothetical protein [Lentibacillus sp. CBA3610]